MTTVEQAYEAVLEYTRGHTMLACEVSDRYLVTSASGPEVQFRVDCKREALTHRRQSVSLIMDAMTISVFAPVVWVREPEDPWVARRIELAPEEFSKQTLVDQNGMSHVTLYFCWEMPQMGSSGITRSVTFRNGYIHHLN